MHQISVTQLSATELNQRYEGVEGIPEGAFEHLLGLAKDGPQVLETTFGTSKGVVEVLVFALPHLSLEALAGLAQAKPIEYNEATTDLLTNNSYLAWCAGELEVRLDFGSCRNFPGSLEAKCFVVIFTSSAGAAVAEHMLDEDGVDEMLCTLQSCASGAGINYTPFRLYSEEEFEAAKDSVPEPRPRLITATVLRLSGGNDVEADLQPQ